MSGSSDTQPIDGDHKWGLGHRNDVPLISVDSHGHVQIESSQLVYGAGQAIVASTGANALYKLQSDSRVCMRASM